PSFFTLAPPPSFFGRVGPTHDNRPPPGPAPAARAHVSSPSSSPSSSRYTARSSSNVPASGDAHSPRSAASSSRSAMPRSAHGLDLRRNALVPESNTYEAASCSYIQSSTTPAVAS